MARLSLVSVRSAGRAFLYGCLVAVCVAVMLPCSAQAVTSTAIKIMPLGDSITNGTGNQSGYRLKLYTDLAAAGYDVDFVGSLQTNSCAALPDWDHEGHPGFNIDNIANGWSTIPGIDTYLGPGGYDPDIILLMIGTNDVSEQRDFAHAPDRLSSLISRISDRTTGLKPDAHMIVATIPPRSNKPYDYDTQWYNSQLVTVVQQHIAAGENLSLVDMYGPLNASDIDGVHPYQVGYDKIADIWFAGIQAVLVPEPASMMSLLAGAAWLARRRRKTQG